jgi:hypothetical protein
MKKRKFAFYTSKMRDKNNLLVFLKFQGVLFKTFLFGFYSFVNLKLKTRKLKNFIKHLD